MGISVVTSVYNATPLVVEMFDKLFLDGMIRYAPPGTELVLIDDKSPLRKETEACVRRAESRMRVAYHANDRNLGMTANGNRGLRMAEGDLILLANSDIRVTAGALESLEGLLLASDTHGIVGPVTNNACGFNPQQVDGFEGLEDYSQAEIVKIDRYAGAVRETLDGTYEVRRLVGCCMLMRKSFVEELGGYDESFGHGYFEEVDLCARAVDAGHKLLVDRSTFVFHGGLKRTQPVLIGKFGAQSMRTRRWKASLWMWRNLARVVLKHGLLRIWSDGTRDISMKNPRVAAP